MVETISGVSVNGKLLRPEAGTLPPKTLKTRIRIGVEIGRRDRSAKGAENEMPNSHFQAEAPLQLS